MNRTGSSIEGLPAELLRGVPRQVALTAAGRATLAVAMLLWFGGLLGGVWLYVAAEQDATLRREVANNSVSTVAEVTNVQRRRGDDGKTDVTYRYTADGRDYLGRAQVRRREAAEFAPGARIPVRFLATNPALSWLPRREPQGVEFWLVPLVVLPLCAVGALLALILRRQQWLLAYGRPAVAQVTEARKVRHSHGHGHRVAYRVGFEFHLLSGAQRTGSFEVPKNPPAAGSSSVIVYDPEHPQRSAPYPLPLVKPEAS